MLGHRGEGNRHRRRAASEGLVAEVRIVLRGVGGEGGNQIDARLAGQPPPGLIPDRVIAVRVPGQKSLRGQRLPLRPHVLCHRFQAGLRTPETRSSQKL